jgi:hypothetical protein
MLGLDNISPAGGQPAFQKMATTASFTNIDFEGGQSLSAQLLYIESFPLYFTIEYTLAPFVPKLSDLLKKNKYFSSDLLIFPFTFGPHL